MINLPQYLKRAGGDELNRARQEGIEIGVAQGWDECYTALKEVTPLVSALESLIDGKISHEEAKNILSNYKPRPFAPLPEYFKPKQRLFKGKHNKK